MAQITLAAFDPWRFLSEPARVRLLIYAGLLTMALALFMGEIGASLKTSAAPWGIISLELSATWDDARVILGSWGPAARADAALVVGMDFLFLVSYAVFLSLMCVQVAGKLYAWHSVPALVGVALSWAMLLAGAADAVENVALIQILRGSGLFLWPAVSYWSAVPKFVTMLLAVAFCLWGWLFYLNSLALHQFREGARAAGQGDS